MYCRPVAAANWGAGTGTHRGHDGPPVLGVEVFALEIDQAVACLGELVAQGGVATEGNFSSSGASEGDGSYGSEEDAFHVISLVFAFPRMPDSLALATNCA